MVANGRHQIAAEKNIHHRHAFQRELTIEGLPWTIL